MADIRAQILYTVERLDDMLRKLADVTGYEKEATAAAQVAGGAFANMGDQASDAASGLNDFANGLHNVADGVRDLKDAMGQPVPTSNNSNNKEINGTIYGGPNAGKVGHYDGENI